MVYPPLSWIAEDWDFTEFNTEKWGRKAEMGAKARVFDQERDIDLF